MIRKLLILTFLFVSVVGYSQKKRDRDRNPDDNQPRKERVKKEKTKKEKTKKNKGDRRQANGQDATANNYCDLNLHYNSPTSKIDKKNFVFTDYQPVRVYNTVMDYGVFQLGKVKGHSSPFLLIKTTPTNSCVQKDNIVQIFLRNGDNIELDNDYDVNCDGTVVSNLSSSDIKKIQKGMVNKIIVYSFQMDLEYEFTDENAVNFSKGLHCISHAKVK